MHSYLFSQELMDDGKSLHERFRSALPFAHLVIDDVLPDNVVTSLVEEFPAPDARCWGLHKHEHSNKLACGDDAFFGEVTRQLIWEMNSSRFLRFLQSVSGIEGLIPDAWLAGAGLHQTSRGGFLDIHADFNFHPVWKLERRLNLLLYLNRDWQDEYAGHLELWDSKMQRCCSRIAPVANRMVIFQTSDYSYHGHPVPLNCPENRTRKSIAAYFYTSGCPSNEVSAPHSTLYVRRD